MNRTGPLSLALVNHVLQTIPTLTIAVIGDLFLDRYWDLDANLTETSLETNLAAYQVVNVRSQPGAAGTVLNNLVALGVGRIVLVSVIGDDGEGYELRQAFARQPTVDVSHLIVTTARRTPTYTKPMLHESAESARELNRFDIKNRQPLPPDLGARLLDAVPGIADRSHGIAVLDQVSEENCGVVTDQVRELLGRWAVSRPAVPILADSRERIGQFRNMMLKPNRRECLQACSRPQTENLTAPLAELTRQTGRPVFCTLGDEGILLSVPEGAADPTHVPAYPVTGPIDIVGAGDSTSAGILCALAAKVTPLEAAAFGNLVASITIQQLGTTGTATPQQVYERWHEAALL